MFVGGIDLSTHAIDLVLVDIDGFRKPWWHRFDLYGPDAWERTRTVRQTMPGPTSQLWDEVVAFGIEDPRGQNAGVLYRVQGAVLACLPPATLVHPLVPSEWRKLVGLKGNSSKQDVDYFAHVSRGHNYSEGAPDDEWPQDASDAYCIALATQTLISTEKAA